MFTYDRREGQIMLFFKKVKDGGPKSPVDAYFLCEIKGLFSIALLKFNRGGREEYHTHAFNAWTWFLKGHMYEQDVLGFYYTYKQGWLPKKTPKEKCHRVHALKDSWCLTIRGPWEKYWYEVNNSKRRVTILTHKRDVVEEGVYFGQQYTNNLISRYKEE